VVGGRPIEVSSTEIPDDWADRWRDFHKPLLVGERLWLRPSWEPAREGAIDLVVDPGQAFGTGAHPTTRLCLEFLLELADAGENEGGLVDLGTGSGVLAIAAAKLGWSPVTGYDHEPAAIEAAGANASVNDVTVELHRTNLRESLPDLATTCVANMTSPILKAVAGHLDDEAPRVLVLSGILPPELDEVAAAFAPVGFAEHDRRQMGDWAALLLRRPL
jgi:ribosomal protein L11 methyltransferase